MTAEHFYIWAKSDHSSHADNVDKNVTYHPLAYHMLDVAAVAERVIAADARRIERLSEQLGADADDVARVSLWLAAMHDIGKASAAFQLKNQHLWRDDIFGAGPSEPCLAAHGSVTGWYLHHDNEEFPDAPPSMAKILRGTTGLSTFSARALIDAVAGHHGRPVTSFATSRTGAAVPPRKIGPLKLRLAARALAQDLAELFEVSNTQDNQNQTKTWNDHALISYSWWLATLIPFSDWIGSNDKFFEIRTPANFSNFTSVPEYWQVAQHNAAGALRDLGLTPAAIREPKTFSLLPEMAEASPIQKWAQKTVLPKDGPCLAIIEDATGSGKTEAALMLAHRLMDKGFAKGFFVALPTMATANAMHDRLRILFAKLFEDDPSQPAASLSLAHGRARAMQKQISDQDSPVVAWCSDWIAAENRKAFFAQAGVGTIDQAVLAVLTSKYQTIRLRGMADKVLIIDEAHAFDTYMSAEVQALLRFHASQGGSAILLSATLPLSQRQAYARAFAEGARWADTQALTETAYPLATFLSAEQTVETPGKTRAGTERKVTVRRVETKTEAEALAIAAASDGAAVAIIRSTVDEALRTYEHLKGAIASVANINVQVFHSRFLFDDRQAIEQDVVARFGKDSKPDQRRGQILVATQVIEQSLDCDFDVIITDLAPIDLLIQRAGRLWRHPRGRERPENVRSPILHVVSPKPDLAGTDKQFEEALPEVVWVYSNPSLLVRTAEHLFKAGEIETRTLAGGKNEDVPGHPRNLVEAVYSDADIERLSASLQAADDEAQGKGYGETEMARRATLHPLKAYNSEIEPWLDEAAVVTRLGDSLPVRVAIEDGTQLVPLAERARSSNDWSLTELRLRPSIAGNILTPMREQLAALTPPWADYESDIRLLVLHPAEDGAWLDDTGDLAYHPKTGLSRSQHTQG